MLYDPLSATRYFSVLRPYHSWEIDRYVVSELEAVYGTSEYARTPARIVLSAQNFADTTASLESWTWIAVTLDRNGVASAYAEDIGTESETLSSLPESRRRFGNIAVFPYDDATGFDPITNPPQQSSGSQFVYEIAEIRVFSFVLRIPAA